MAQDEVDPSELFSSPIKPSELPPRPKTPKTPTPASNNNTAPKEKQPFDAEEVREAQLRRELEGVRNINEVIEGVIGTLERAKGNMGVRFIPFLLTKILSINVLTPPPTSPYPKPSPTLPPSSTPGRASSHKQNTTSDSSCTATGMAPRPTSRPSRKPSGSRRWPRGAAPPRTRDGWRSGGGRPRRVSGDDWLVGLPAPLRPGVVLPVGPGVGCVDWGCRGRRGGGRRG